MSDRETQIREAALKFFIMSTDQIAFMAGASWADKNKEAKIIQLETALVQILKCLSDVVEHFDVK